MTCLAATRKGIGQLDPSGVDELEQLEREFTLAKARPGVYAMVLQHRLKLTLTVGAHKRVLVERLDPHEAITELLVGHLSLGDGSLWLRWRNRHRSKRGGCKRFSRHGC